MLLCDGGESGLAANWDELVRDRCFQKALHRPRPTRRDDPYLLMSMLRLWASDLRLAGSAETEGEFGICVAYVGGQPASADGDVVILRASGHGPAYLAYLLNASVAAPQNVRMAQADAILRIRADHLARVLLFLPPLYEQHAIAIVPTDMDTEIAAMESRLDKTGSSKQGMMQQFLPGSVRLPIPDGTEEETGGA